MLPTHKPHRIQIKTKDHRCGKRSNKNAMPNVLSVTMSLSNLQDKEMSQSDISMLWSGLLWGVIVASTVFISIHAHSFQQLCRLEMCKQAWEKHNIWNAADHWRVFCWNPINMPQIIAVHYPAKAHAVLQQIHKSPRHSFSTWYTAMNFHKQRHDYLIDSREYNCIN